MALRLDLAGQGAIARESLGYKDTGLSIYTPQM